VYRLNTCQAAFTKLDLKVPWEGSVGIPSAEMIPTGGYIFNLLISVGYIFEGAKGDTIFGSSLSFAGKYSVFQESSFRITFAPDID
jgi:hypothetical protein